MRRETSCLSSCKDKSYRYCSRSIGKGEMGAVGRNWSSATKHGDVSLHALDPETQKFM